MSGYAPPQGPSNINDPAGPGLHGDNCGNSGEQGDSKSDNDADDSSSGRPGIGGTNHGNTGTQHGG